MKKDYVTAAMIVVAAIMLDQVSKWMIRMWMDVGASHRIIPNFLYITHHQNEGAAWGILPGQMRVFIIITLVAIALFLVLAKELDFLRKKIFSIALALLFAGAIGNFIDRIRYQYVVDFIDFHIFGYNFPVFNVADICLTFGVALFAFDLLVLDAKRKKDHEA